MKRKSDPRNGKKLQELKAKALRRGDKMANTLRKLIANGRKPSDAPVETFLGKLEQVLAHLRQSPGQRDGPTAPPAARRTAKASGTAGRRKDKRQLTSAAAE